MTIENGFKGTKKWRDWYFNFLTLLLLVSIWLDGLFTWYGMTIHDLPEGNPIWVYFIEIFGVVPVLQFAVIGAWVLVGFLFYFRYNDEENVRLYYTVLAVLIAIRFLCIGGWAGMATILGGHI